MYYLLCLLLFGIGLFYGNVLEYFIHRYLFHKIGLKKKSIFSYHIRGHHVLARKNKFIDLTSSRVEDIGLFFLIVIHLPLLLLSKAVFFGMFLYAILFKVLHGVQHKHPKFCKRFFSWHWEHHMKKSNENYGVVAPWCDYIFKTRKRYDK